MDHAPRPTLYLLAGPNGSGKSTIYETILKPLLKAPFINADLIQRNELENPEMAAAYEAARIAERRRAEHIAQRRSFITESTFSDARKLALIADAKAAGFRIVVYHVSVGSPNLSVARVAMRVEEGGHDVPEQKVRERYARNQPLIREAVLQADRAFIYDNSALNRPPKLAISFESGRVDRIAQGIPAWARALYATELARFIPAR